MGRKIELDEREYTIIGVMPKGLVYPPSIDLYLPWAPTPAQLNDRADHEYMVVGRLRPGVTAARGRRGTARNRGASRRRCIRRRIWDGRSQVEPLLDNISGELTPLYTRLMLGATLFVLLIVCANVANLQFARGIARRPEMAMRTALGAPREAAAAAAADGESGAGAGRRRGWTVARVAGPASDAELHAASRGALGGGVVHDSSEWARPGLFAGRWPSAAGIVSGTGAGCWRRCGSTCWSN